MTGRLRSKADPRGSGLPCQARISPSQADRSRAAVAVGQPCACPVHSRSRTSEAGWTVG